MDKPRTILKCECGHSLMLLFNESTLPYVKCISCKRDYCICTHSPVTWFTAACLELVKQASEQYENPDKCINAIDNLLALFDNLAENIICMVEEENWRVDFELSMEKYRETMGRLRVTYVLISEGFSRLPAGYDAVLN